MAEKENKGPSNLDELKGRARTAYGELAGDEEQKEKGTIDKATGKVKAGIDAAREKLQELTESDESKSTHEGTKKV